MTFIRCDSTKNSEKGSPGFLCRTASERNGMVALQPARM
ncbi:hypothetical protein AtDm6_0631 [Acetobacter tropicalis]|uniref:Uncharacterized protein n=1 Tax=Acetobacter tropicalis TaxID=104102 RepID=A0A094ZTJ2_9PROT|nr:hypothetical protein AtDm6_0631 [Acetobacter tropicalis]